MSNDDVSDLEHRTADEVIELAVYLYDQAKPLVDNDAIKADLKAISAVIEEVLNGLLTPIRLEQLWERLRLIELKSVTRSGRTRNDNTLVSKARLFLSGKTCNQPEATQTIPANYILLSEATSILYRADSKKLSVPPAVRKARAAINHKFGVGTLELFAEINRELRATLLRGELRVYFVHANAEGFDALVVPIEVLDSIIPVLGGIPDRPTRFSKYPPTLRTRGPSSALPLEFGAEFQSGHLCLAWESFREWRKRRGLSTSTTDTGGSQKQAKRGRPEEFAWIEPQILFLVTRGEWSASQPIAKLRQLLVIVKGRRLPGEKIIRTRLDKLAEKPDMQHLQRNLRSSSGINH